MSDNRAPKLLTPRRFRTLLGLFPPYLTSRTRVVRVAEDFRSCRVRVRPSLLTRNLQGSMFGGTIYAAADPFFALLYWQVFARRGVPIQAWVKSARVSFLKPASTALTLDFELSQADVDEGDTALRRHGRFSRTHTTRAIDQANDPCAELEIEVYLRLPREGQRQAAFF